VLGDDGVDAIAIATPALSHGLLTRDALQAGKHVLVEKPLAASAAEALDVIELARRRGLVLMPGHTFLYSPPVNLVRDYIATGELGEILFISASRVNLGLHQPDVSVAWDLAPHDLSILRYWLGERPTTVNAIARCCIIPSVPDIAFVNLEFPSGTIAHVELSWLAPSKLRRTTVVGSRKMVVYDDTSAEPVRLFDSGVALRDPQSFGEYRMTYRTGSIISPRVEPVEPLLVEVDDFVRSVRTGSTPRSDANIGLDVVLTIEAVERSLAAGGIPSEVERPPQLLLGARSR
jgi:predicted dehydrogenase